MKRIFIDADKCVGCKNCAIACKQARRKEGSMYDLDLTDIQFEARNSILLDSKNKYIPLFCRHCDKPECVWSCMSGAMAKDSQSGHVFYDKDKCGECFMCVMNCPYGVLKVDQASGTYVVKCDFCSDYPDGPNCVKKCPTEAIYVEEVLNV